MLHKLNKTFIHINFRAFYIYMLPNMDNSPNALYTISSNISIYMLRDGPFIGTGHSLKFDAACILLISNTLLTSSYT